MTIKSLNVEELSREMKRGKSIVIQEVKEKNARQWMFEGERLLTLREQQHQTAAFPDGATVFLVCEDDARCHQYAKKTAEKGFTVHYLAGGHLAWNQYYHAIVVGFDEQVKVWQIHRLAKGCLSYMIVSGEAMIVDPSYHIDYFLGLAHREQTDIKCVVDTQIHRDHVSGGARLAAKTSSPYYVPFHKELQADLQPLEEQTSLPLGTAQIDVIPLASSEKEDERSFGLLINGRFLLSGDVPLHEPAFQEAISANPHLKQTTDAAIVLPAHTHTLNTLNDHGIVGTTLGDVKDDQSPFHTQGSAISATMPRAVEQEIYQINLTQKDINLDKANELEMGIGRHA